MIGTWRTELVDNCNTLSFCYSRAKSTEISPTCMAAASICVAVCVFVSLIVFEDRLGVCGGLWGDLMLFGLLRSYWVCCGALLFIWLYVVVSGFLVCSLVVFCVI